MYLSKLKIKNYRSIHNLELSFSKGKNVIIGKNNAGKSNIVKAIDIVLGESSPAYNKYENITLNDFYNGTTEDILIWVELSRGAAEVLNYEEIYKAYGFKYHAVRRWGEARPYTLDGSSFENFMNDLSAAMQINEDDVETNYVNPKIAGAFENQFENKYHFAYCFRAFLEGTRIQKDIRFFYRENTTSRWTLAFSAPIRNELLQSAIINSFRDPSNELRINQWSWYGKLLRKSIDTNNVNLQSAFSLLGTVSNELFTGLHSKLKDSHIKIAFPNTEICFQFNPDTKVDVYKSTLVYVNDGFNSLLQNKGSGIQSAVIIGLFDYYTRFIAHATCTLLAVEEPELYLHPQARRVISNRLDDFTDNGKNQVIITTHSSEFIASAQENLNIILAFKGADGTTATNTCFDSSKVKQLLLKSQNTEMFFADKVILVEGGDKYILEAICQHFGKEIKPELGENWLNDFNFSIIAVGGKEEFYKYSKLLNELKVPFSIVADFDFMLRGLARYYTALGLTERRDEHNGILGKIGELNPELPPELDSIVDTFREGVTGIGLKYNEDKLRSMLRAVQKKKKLSDFNQVKQENLLAYKEALTNQNLFILTGELEDYYTAAAKSGIANISGKEEKPIHIVSNLMNETNSVTAFIIIDEFVEIIQKITNDLHIPAPVAE